MTTQKINKAFIFSNTPTIHAQVDHIINRATSRSFVLRYLAGFGADKQKLKNIYCSIIRSVMEYSSVTFGPMLAKYEKNCLENVQKKCLRIIYGYGIEYEDLLRIADLETLQARREKALLKFATKTSSSPQFKDWFPLNKNRSSQRNSKEFEEKFARSDRLYNSPLYACLLYTSPSPRDRQKSRMPSSA